MVTYPYVVENLALPSSDPLLQAWKTSWIIMSCKFANDEYIIKALFMITDLMRNASSTLLITHPLHMLHFFLNNTEVMLCYLFAALVLRCAIYRLPDAHEHIARPPHGVKFPKKVLNFLPAAY